MRLIVYCICLNCLVAISSVGQTLSTKNKKAIEFYTEADNFRVRGQFDQAIKLLKQSIDKDKKFEEAYYRMAITYKSMGDRSAASDSFEKGLELTSVPAKQKTYLGMMGENYLKSGQYEKAKTALEKFLTIEKADKVKIEYASLWKAQSEYALAHQSEHQGYQVKPLSDTINRFPMQYFPVITADGQQLFYTRRLGKNDTEDEDIVIANKLSKGWSDPVSVSENINTRRNEGACTISADGRYMIFVAETPGRHTDLYESKKVGDEWAVPVNMGPNINSSLWDSHPSLSADGNELYFVSSRPGGVGGRDIWYAKKDALGRWMRAVNLGKPINTKFDEIAPYIHVNNHNLYFASNGNPDGFGGFDIYVTERDKQWQQPKNLGAPLNDFEDQFSFVVASDGSTAFYTHEEGRFKSQIYQTNIPKELQIRSKGNVVKGIVSNAETKKPIKAAVELFELKLNEKISSFTSDSLNGNYLIVVPGKAEYALHVSEPGYLFYTMHFNYEEEDQDQPLVINIGLQPIKKNAVAVLNNIFFEYNKFDVNPRSFAELDNVIKFLNDNPSVKVEISGHTDNVGNESYNQQLSLKRAQSVVNYFTSKGIAATRLTQIGYGSKKPIKSNDTEEDRQANRRIEFRIE